MWYGWVIRPGPPRSHGVSGRSPGFSASIEHVLDDDLVVAVTSNVYSSITERMAPDLAAIARGEERKAVLPETPVAVSAAVLARYSGRYRLGPDFSPMARPASGRAPMAVSGASSRTFGRDYEAPRDDQPPP